MCSSFPHPPHLTHLLDHGLETKVCLRGSQLLHHDLQLLKADCPAPRDVVPANLVFFLLFCYVNFNRELEAVARIQKIKERIQKW